MSGEPTADPRGHGVLRRVIGSRRRDLLIASVFTSSHQAGEALVPIMIGVIIDSAVATGEVLPLLWWTAVLAVVFVGLSYSYRFGARAAERASEMAAHDLRLQLMNRVLDDRGGASSGRLSGELVNIATSDAKRAGAINLTLPFGLAAVVALLVSTVALLQISWTLGLLVLLGLPPVLIAIRLIGIPLERRTDQEQERAAHASGIATDLIRGLRVLKGIGGEQVALQRYRTISQQSLVATLRAARAEGAHDGAVLALTGAFIAVLVLVGGRLAAGGEISIGELVTTCGLALFLIEPLSAFGWINSEFAQARASAVRIAAVLGAPAAVRSGTGSPADPVRGAVQLRGVTHDELTGVDLEVRAGELLGVVAPSPAVAAALLRCLARDVDPDAGTVELDGVPLTEFDPSAARARILVAAHDAVLFTGSLAENVGAAIGAGRPGGFDGALRAATADEVAAGLPSGIETPLSERGRSLSGGQRQRVALARALAADPPVLVLHDPTTAVDSVTESRISAAVRELRRDRTTIVVTTSPALLAVADRVLVLDGTGVRAEGTHAELAARDGAYRELVLR